MEELQRKINAKFNELNQIWTGELIKANKKLFEEHGIKTPISSLEVMAKYSGLMNEVQTAFGEATDRVNKKVTKKGLFGR